MRSGRRRRLARIESSASEDEEQAGGAMLDRGGPEGGVSKLQAASTPDRHQALLLLCHLISQE